MLQNDQATEAHSLSTLPGIDQKKLKLLERLAIHSIRDLLLHFPLRYQDRTKQSIIASVKVEQEVVIEGVIDYTNIPKRGRAKLICYLKDESGGIFLRFFNLVPFQLALLKPGTRLRCYGQVRYGSLGLELMHPDFQKIKPNQPVPIPKYLTPIYPTTEGLSQYALRKWMTHALVQLDHHPDFQADVQAEDLTGHLLPTIKEAIFAIHQPRHDVSLFALEERKTPAQQRIIFEELLAHRLGLLRLKERLQTHESFPLDGEGALSLELLTQLPFPLTGAQQRVFQEVKEDMARKRPMLRLVQGDVGSGKTVIAMLAMLLAVEKGYQAVLMAPTELLAEQHYQNFQTWCKKLSVNVGLLIGHMKGKARSLLQSDILENRVSLIIGTHAVFQESIHFSKLALVVVDEQHRFGVEQRAMLHEKGRLGALLPHQLIMTATPIPRTLMMGFYAGLDCSTIDELPPGRTPIVTSVFNSALKRHDVIARVKQACLSGRQVYWVCPLINESELLSAQAATSVFDEFVSLFPELKIGLIHGRLTAEEKQNVMQAFKLNEIQLLVATTVIEVGVDVPNASVMVIENAERLGLSQLHQLRGRVGRGVAASFCVLLYQSPLSQMGKARLTVLRETTDGFKIAERDLALRGPGEVLGTHQTGMVRFYLADWARDQEWSANVSAIANQILLSEAELGTALINRWAGKRVEYMRV